MLFLWALATLIVAFISRDIIKKYFIPTKKPPLASGALPVLGHLYTIDFSNFHEEVLRLAKDLGSVFRIAVGGRDWVVLASYDDIKNVFESEGDRFVSRPVEFLNSEVMMGHNLGILNTNGDAWAEQRRFVFNSLHMLSVDLIPQKVNWQVAKLVQLMEKHAAESENGRAVGLPGAYFKDVVNAIMADAFVGVDYNFSSKEFARIQELAGKVGASLASGNRFLVNHWPWTRCLPLDFFAYKSVKKANQELESVLERIIDAKVSQAFSDHDSDLADVYMQELHRRQIKREGKGSFSKKQLVRVIVDMWAVGTDKVVEMLNCLILFMIRYPDIQEKAHLEIQEKVGYERPIRADDRENLKYLRACIIEAHRIGSVMDVTYLHESREYYKVGEFDIPRNTPVVASLYTVHMNPERYLQPDKYIPERFVDRDAKKVHDDPNIIPYGIGKRSCVGEDFSKTMIFMIFASMIQKFKFLALPGRDFADLKFIRQSVLQPVQFRCAFEKRPTEIPEKIELE